jgi:hypothetical protein
MTRLSHSSHRMNHSYHLMSPTRRRSIRLNCRPRSRLSYPPTNLPSCRLTNRPTNHANRHSGDANLPRHRGHPLTGRQR